MVSSTSLVTFHYFYYYLHILSCIQYYTGYFSLLLLLLTHFKWYPVLHWLLEILQITLTYPYSIYYAGISYTYYIHYILHSTYTLCKFTYSNATVSSTALVTCVSYLGPLFLLFCFWTRHGLAFEHIIILLIAFEHVILKNLKGKVIIRILLDAMCSEGIWVLVF